MNKCLNCGKETDNEKFCSISCQNSNQNTEKANKRYGVFKNFEVICNKCGGKFFVNEREKLFPKKEKYFCSRSCANSRKHSEKTKTKISEKIKKIKHKDKIKLNCKKCKKEFEVVFNRRHQEFCSRSCSSIWREKNNKIEKREFKRKKIIKNDNDKTFIYSLEYPVGNVRYIGKSDFPEKRLKRHIQEAKRRNKSHKDKWINSLNEIPILKIIEEVFYSEWHFKEIYWIKSFKEKGYKLVNGTDGGEGSNGFQGKKHSKETKSLLSILSTGRVSSEETKNKIRGENNCRCKLKDNDVREIYYMYFSENINVKIIAKKYDITKKYVYHLISGVKRGELLKKYKEKMK